jgi:hypothetical protein
VLFQLGHHEWKTKWFPDALKSGCFFGFGHSNTKIFISQLWLSLSLFVHPLQFFLRIMEKATRKCYLSSSFLIFSKKKTLQKAKNNVV